MKTQFGCYFCGSKRFWKLRRNHLKCKKCYREITRKVGSINLSRYQWQKIIHWFVLEQSTNKIQEQTSISKYYILKALLVLREKMLLDIPRPFKGIVEADETYLGGQMKNRRLKAKKKLGKNRRGFGTIKQPVFGILCRSGKVWAELIDKTEAPDLQPIIQKKVEKGSIICTDTWRGYTGIAAKGYVHRLVKHNEGEYSDYQGNYINGLEGFWGYLKRKLAAKGGIRESRLRLYLGEYVWRYNHRYLNVKEQTKYLLNLVAKI
jgi:transposase-like protein